MEHIFLIGIVPFIFNALLPLALLLAGLAILKLDRKNLRIRPLFKPLAIFVTLLYLFSVGAGVIVLLFLEGNVYHQWDLLSYFFLIGVEYPTLAICASWIAYGYTFGDLYLWWLLATIVIFSLSILVLTKLYQSEPYIKNLKRYLIIFSGLWIVVFGALSYPYQGQMSPAERRQQCVYGMSNPRDHVQTFHDYRDELGLSFSTETSISTTVRLVTDTGFDEAAQERTDEYQLVLILSEVREGVWENNPNQATVTMRWVTGEARMEHDEVVPEGAGRQLGTTEQLYLGDTNAAELRQWYSDRGVISQFTIYPDEPGVFRSSDRLLEITVEPYMSDEIWGILDSVEVER